MPHHYRREGSGRWRDEHAGRNDRNRDRYRDDRFSPHQEADFNQDRDSDRSYFAESADQDRHGEHNRGGHQWQDRGAQGHDQAGRRTGSHGDQSWSGPQAPRIDREHQSGQRYGQGSNQGDSGARMMRWNDDRDDGQYFGTGSYHGAYSTGPASRASGGFSNEHSYLGYRNPMWRDEPQAWREDDARSAGSTGSSQVYAGSSYGAQGGFDRPYESAPNQQRTSGQDYREQFAEQRYGRQPAFGYGFTEGASGSFRGRGPKGYERSDERLREMICERLTDDPRIDASEVHIEVKDKVVKLTGRVPDRRTKYEMEDLVEHCGGVKDIDNQVRVGSGTGITPTVGTALGHDAALTESSSGSTGNAARSKRN